MSADAGTPLRLGVLGSGRGSNFVAIQQAVERGELNAEVKLVISDTEDAPILAHARSHGIPVRFVPPGKFRTRMEEESEHEVVRQLREADVELVVLAGFMRMIKQPLLEAFPRAIINIHPSLLPAFPGIAAWKQALDGRVPVTGCTVHWVDAGMDSGAIIDQAEVPVMAGDTAESLHARIQIAEHQLYPRVIGRLVSRLRA